MRPLRTADILLTLFWAGLLINWGFEQFQTKQEFQLNLFMFGLATLLMLVFAYSYGASVPFYMLMFYLLCDALFKLLMIPLSRPNPSVIVDGKHHPVMNMSWVLPIFLAIIITPFVLWFYYKKVKRNRTFDIAVIAAFLIITFCIYTYQYIQYASTCPSCSYFDW